MVLPDESRILQRAQAGDQEAFGLLVAATRDKIRNYCTHKLGDPSAAEDLTQEVFLEAYSHLPSFRREASFTTWIYRIAHNKVANALRSRKHEVPLLEERLEAPKESPPPALDPEEKQALLALLPPKQRQVLELNLEGASQKEIAAFLGIPHGTVRSRLFYARKKLRQSSSNNFK